MAQFEADSARDALRAPDRPAARLAALWRAYCARYWLDLVRYAESDGFKSDDLRPTRWRYRDYVIQSFNEDAGFDRFMVEQLAGDEASPDDPQCSWRPAICGLARTKKTAATWPTSEIIYSTISPTCTGQVFLGLTIGCPHVVTITNTIRSRRLIIFACKLSSRRLR